MTEGNDPAQLRGDQPLRAGDVDAIGFREVAGRVAEALTRLRADASLVIGLEGRWGSGKSSLLSEIEQALALSRETQPHTVVRFRPWLVGTRDALLGQLFGELEAGIARIQAAKGDTTRSTLIQVRRTEKAARRFAAALGRAGSAVEAVGNLSAVAPVRWAGKTMKVLGEWFGREPELKSLDLLKTRLAVALKTLNHRIIVTIDDVDRLEPGEMLEVLRLVRSVGDLPNIVYLLCYDSDILADGVRQAAQVPNGHAYLEKIVQLTVPVPQPETFQLRFWFEDALAAFAGPRDEDSASRLRTIIDVEGARRLTTPRAVVRALDALRFLLPALENARVDLADMVWLQLIKDGNPRLYRWIERYCAVAAEMSLGTVRVDNEERAKLLAELVEAAEKDWFAPLHYRHYFAEQLSGLELDYTKGGPLFRLFGNVDEHKRDRAIACRRLASPDHYRLYFALSDPSHALKQADFDGFWAASRNSAEAVSRLLVEMHRPDPGRSLGKADILLERIRGSDPEFLTFGQCENILFGFADGLDDLYRARPFERFWATGPWDRAERLLSALLRRLNHSSRSATIDSMFGEGRALSWLTMLFRREMFAHGRAGDQAKPENEHYFASEELDRVAAAMLARYREMSLDDILASISPIDILFAWSQGGDADEAEKLKRFLAEQAQNDDRFLRLLDGLRSTIVTSDGSCPVLKLDHVAAFLDSTATKERLDQIAADVAEPARAAHAQALLGSLRSAKDY